MKILVTAGGTREPLDEVRYLGNVSSGRTGAWIVEEAVRRYHTVFLLAGKGAEQPAQWAMDTGLVVAQEFGSAVDLLQRCTHLCQQHEFQAVVFAAAVADYAPQPVQGKVPSQLDEWLVRLVPTPKVVDVIPRLAPDAVLVGFKLESGVSREELVSRARHTGRRCQARFMVANDTSGLGSASHEAVLVDVHGRETVVPHRRALAEVLITTLEEACQQTRQR
jgi:phosphopantothenoylcysteine synthetase/decarboxylase